MVARLLAVNSKTLLLVAGFVPNDALIPAPMPVADSVTLPVKPPVGPIVIVLVPLELRMMLTLVGEAERVKLADWAAVTVSETMAVCVTPPPVPVTLIG